MGEQPAFRTPIIFVLENVGDSIGELIHYQAPKTIGQIERNLPLEGRTALSKKGIYFRIPVLVGKEKAKSKVEKGTIAYWPQGNALCVFYDETEVYSPVNIIGRITKNLQLFAQARSGTRITVKMLANDN